MNTSNQAVEHEKFEQWAVSQGFSITRGSQGLYTSLRTNQLFSGWLGRATLASPPEVAQGVVTDAREPSGGHYTGFTNEKGEAVNVGASARGNHTIDIDLCREGEKVFEHSVSSLEARNLAAAMAGVCHFENPLAATRAPVAVNKFGGALAMQVLQSDLYHQLNGLERAECDELIARWLDKPPAAPGGSVGASREQDSFHLANAGSGEVQWVPVSERLPEREPGQKVSREVLVYDGKRVKTWRVSYEHQHPDFDYGGPKTPVFENANATHWMDTPPPPSHPAPAQKVVPVAEPVEWDGKLNDMLQRALNALYLECPPEVVNELEHTVREGFRAVCTDRATLQHMLKAALAKLPVEDGGTMIATPASVPAVGGEDEQAVIEAAREWSGERFVRDWGDAELMKAICTLDGDWPGCEECDHECDEPCMPATVAQMHRSIDNQIAQLIHEGKLLAYDGYTPPEGFQPYPPRRKTIPIALAAQPTTPGPVAQGEARQDSFHSDSGDRDRVQARLLTTDEILQALVAAVNDRVRRSPNEIVQRKFCEVNNIRILSTSAVSGSGS
jgi:hypothetical protein